MRKKQTLLICAVCALVAIIALLAYKPAPREPSYGGHPLSYWVEMLGDYSTGILYPATAALDPRDEMAATNAINHIGVAALPFLVKWMQDFPPPWRLGFASSFYPSRFPFVQKLSGLFVSQRAWRLSIGTSRAFDVLGEKAMPAASDLCRLMNDTDNPNAANFAAASLGKLGTNALPPLLAIVTNTNHPGELRAAALGSLRVMPGLDNASQTAAIRAITNCVTDTNLQLLAVYVLSQLRTAPPISVPFCL